MHFIRSFAIFATILILPSVVFGSENVDPKKGVKVEGEPEPKYGTVEGEPGKVATKEGEKEVPVPASPVKADVLAIDALFTKKNEHVVNALSNNKVWVDLVSKLHTVDLTGTKNIVTEVNKVLTPTDADTATIQFKKGAAIKPLTDLTGALTQAVFFDDAEKAKTFDPAAYIKGILGVLKKYKELAAADKERAADAADKLFVKAPAIDDLSDPLSKLFDKLNDDSMKTPEQKEAAKTLKNASKNQPPVSGSKWELWHYLALIVVILAIVGAIGAAVYFLVVKPRKN